MPFISSASSSSGFGFGRGSSDLYSFSSFTFTNGGVDSYLPATNTQFVNSYTASGATWASNSAFYTTFNGAQYWTVPATGTYEFRVAGAGGGSSLATSRSGGRGVILQGRVPLIQGEFLRLVVGVRGGRYGYTAGGGGASSIVKVANQTTYSVSTTPLIMAGAGAGGGNSGGAGRDAIFTNSQPGSGYGGHNSGINGSGGNPTALSSSGGWGTSGAGWSGDGGGNSNRNHSNWSGADEALRQNGGASGNVLRGASATHGTGWTSALHDYSGSGSCVGAPGGFGGGGGGQCNGGGGGAGYNGGAAGGQGGASFVDNSVTNQSNFGYNSQDTNGYILVTFIG